MSFADKLRRRHLEKKLETAIIHEDLGAIQDALAEGARAVDHKSSGWSMYGTQWSFATKDPNELAKHVQCSPQIKEALKEGLKIAPPEFENTTLLGFIAGEGGLLDQRREKRLTSMLSDALLKRDIEGIRKALDKGATQVNISLGYAPMGIGFATLQRFRSPVEAAQSIGLPQEAIDLLIARLPSVEHKASKPSL